VHSFIRFPCDFQDYLGEDFGALTEELFSETDLFTDTWSHTNLEELNKSLEMAMGNDNRFEVKSPDSGLGMDSFDFDIDGCNALLGVNDPIFNQFNSDISETVKSPADKVISLEIPVVTSNDYNHEYIQPMESDEEEEEEEEVENEENSPSNIPKNDSVNKIHSYSIIKVKKNNEFKSKNRLIKDRMPNARKISISLNKKPKLYEMEPLKDPKAEKNRLNALNAKKNRDRKKQQLQEAEEEIYRLKEENEDLRSEADRVRDELADAKRELDALRQQLKLRGGENASFLDEREE